MASKKKPTVPILEVPPNATLRQIYDIVKKNFTAADLQKYTDLEEPGVPLEEVVAAMDAIHKKATPKGQIKKL